MLGVVLLALVAWLVAFAVHGSSAAPGTTPAQEQANEQADIRRVANEATLAFLEIDYTQMDELTARVLEYATGDFAQQYGDSVEALKVAAADQESISRGEIFEVGLGEVNAESATVYVAAGSAVQNLGTGGEVEDRFWRIRLSMVKEDGRWLVSQLDFVG